MTEPVEIDPGGLSDAELRRRVRYWRGEGKGAVSARALAGMYESELMRRGLDVPARAGARTMPAQQTDGSLRELGRLVQALKQQGYTEDEVVEYMRQHFRDNPPKQRTVPNAHTLPPASVVRNRKPGEPMPE